MKNKTFMLGIALLIFLISISSVSATLIMNWDMDKKNITNGITMINIVDSQNYNGTFIGVQNQSNRTGIINESRRFNLNSATEEAMTFTEVTLATTWSIDFWANITTPITTAQPLIFGSANDFFSFNDGAFRIYDSGTACDISWTNPVINEWHHYAIKCNPANATIWKDGVYINSKNGCTACGITVNNLGDTFNGGYDYHGEIDEFHVWNNENFTQNNVTNLYHLGLGWNPNLSIDTTPPTTGKSFNISNASIPNNAVYTITSLNINATVNSTNGFNCSLYLKEVLNETKYFNAGYNKEVNYTKTFNDNKYNYSINCTDTSLNTSNTLLKYFWIDTQSPIITSNIEANNTYHSEIMPLNINFSDINLMNYTIKDTCNNSFSNLSGIISPHIFTKNVNVSNCSIAQQQTNITVCDLGNCINFTYLWYNRGKLRIQVKNLINGSLTNNFNILINNNWFVSTTNASIYAENLTLSSYSFRVNASGYEIKNINYTITKTYDEYNLTVYTVNSINFSFYDEETKDLLSSYNLTVELISDYFSVNTSTTTGYLYLDLLYPAVYNIRYKANETYNPNFYYLELLNNSHNDLVLYMIKNISSTVITATVYDEVSNPVERVLIKVYRYNLNTNTYLLVQEGITNFEGITKLNLVINDEYYKFILEKPAGTIKKITSATKIYNTALNFFIVLTESVGEEFSKFKNINYNLLFNNQTNTFIFTYADNGLELSEACLKVYTISANKDILYNQTCSSATSSILMLGVYNKSGLAYRADAYLNVGYGQRLVTSSSWSYYLQIINKNLGMFLVIILTLIAPFVGTWSKSIALIATPLPMIIGIILHLIPLNMGIAISIEVICIIMAIVISRKEN